MAFEARVEAFDFSRAMINYPWLDYPERTRELRKAKAPVQLPCFHYLPKMEEFPPSPERWRKLPNEPGAVPYCYDHTTERYIDWYNMYAKDQKTSKMLWKMRDYSRKLPVMRFRLSGDEDPLKQKRLKELTQSLTSPLEDEQYYAAQALGCLGIRDQFIVEALLWAAHTGPERVKFESCRSLAILGCLNETVVHTLIKQLKGQNELRRLDTLRGLRVALNFWSSAPKDKKIRERQVKVTREVFLVETLQVTENQTESLKRMSKEEFKEDDPTRQRHQVWDEDKLVSVLQNLVKKLSGEEALEAGLCLGFLRPCNSLVREFLLECLEQDPKTKMKALQMLVQRLKIKSEVVTRAILDQMNHSAVLEHRIKAAHMLKTIGLEQIQAQGLERLTFNMLMKKTHDEPFLIMRQTAAETAEELKMRPAMLNLMEPQLQHKDPAVRLEAIISLGVLGIRSQRVFYLLLDLLDMETDQTVKKHLQETLILLASVDPWVQNKLKNKVFFKHDVTPKAKVYGLQRRQKILDENKLLEESIIIKLTHAKLNPIFIAKSSAMEDQQERLSVEKESTFDFSTSSFNGVMTPRQKST